MPLHAQDAGALTLDAALQLAAERSQQLTAQEAAAAAARELAIAAAQAPDPTLLVGIENVPANGPDELSLTRDSMTMRSIGLMRPLTRGDKRAARAARFDREADGALARRALVLAELQEATAAAWLRRYYRERMRDLLSRQRGEAMLQIDAAEAAYRSGSGSRSDVLTARAAAGKIADRIAANERDLELAVIELERWIGDSASLPLSERPPMQAVALQPTDLDAQIAHHPEIAVLATQEQIALAEAEIARTNQRSDWTVEVTYSERGPDFADMLSLNVSKPLQWREQSRQDRELAARLAMVRQASAEREEQTRMHIAEARALLRAWQRNRERLELYTSTLVPLAGERTSAAATAYRAGTGTLDAALDARLDETDTQLDQLALEMETAELWGEINYLVPIAHGAAARSAAR